MLLEPDSSHRLAQNMQVAISSLVSFWVFRFIDFSFFFQICTECQKVGVRVYLANCNGEAPVQETRSFSSLLLTLLNGAQIEKRLVPSVFCRERPEDPHVQRSDELHEPSAYLCDRPRRCVVYPAAAGERVATNADFAISPSCMSLSRGALLCRRRNLQNPPQPFGSEAEGRWGPEASSERVFISASCSYIWSKLYGQPHI